MVVAFKSDRVAPGPWLSNHVPTLYMDPFCFLEFVQTPDEYKYSGLYEISAPKYFEDRGLDSGGHFKEPIGLSSFLSFLSSLLMISSTLCLSCLNLPDVSGSVAKADISSN